MDPDQTAPKGVIQTVWTQIRLILESGPTVWTQIRLLLKTVFFLCFRGMVAGPFKRGKLVRVRAKRGKLLT